jgi:hypothetical protein
MSRKPPRCDHCGRRIRPSHHSARLSDFLIMQTIGEYHANPACMAAALKYTTDGADVRVSYLHPLRCGPSQENCDDEAFSQGFAA